MTMLSATVVLLYAVVVPSNNKMMVNLVTFFLFT